MSELGARASGQGRIFQATGDQYVEEHHHHYDAGADGPFFGPYAVSPATASVQTAPDSVRMPLVGRVPGILRNREELRELLGAVTAEPGGAVHVVHGMGGCGKTALAYWLFTDAVREQGRLGFWVNASERMSLRAGMLAIAGDRGAATGELAAAAAGQRAPADLVWHYLDHSSEPWLLVLDNADDPTVLEDGAWLRTSGRGTVLVTTRHATSELWRRPGVTRHALGVLPLEDAAQVLCDLAPDAGDLESARMVAKRLGRLPLALTLAGSHLAHQLLESWSMEEYDRKLAEESTAIVDQGASGYGGGQSRHLVGRTWQLSLDALADQELPEATTLLRLLSLLAADPVPLSVLAPVARGDIVAEGLEPALTAGKLEPALRGLLDHSLAELVEVDGARCVRAHGVLLDSVAVWLVEGQRLVLAEVAAALLEAALPERGAESGAVSRLAVLAPHARELLEKVPSERTAALAVRTVWQVFDAGEIAAAVELAPWVAQRSETLLGPQNRTTLDARHVEAVALNRMGHYAESEALYRSVIASRELVLGPDHPDTLSSCYGLTWPLFLAGRAEEAEGWARRALDGQRRVLGEEDPETLLTWANVIEIRPYVGKAQEFIPEADALIRTCERVLPSDHLAMLIARHNYAEGLRALQRYEEAEPLARRVLADYIRLRGADHPISLAALTLTARIARGLERFDEAVATLGEVIGRRERVLGAEHPFVVENREWLAEWQAEARR
jgi:tetratricopeptide (TPR) repeat protein